MADERPIQHTPKHLVEGVFDPRHPAASAFAPLQPAAGVVADDVEERGQNLAGGPTASAAQAQHSDQREKLQEQYIESLQRSVGTAGPAAKVEGDQARPTTAKKDEDKAVQAGRSATKAR